MQKTDASLEDFVQFALLPENADKDFELIDGEIIEMAPARTSTSRIPLQIVGAVYMFCRSRGIPCYMSGADGAYDVQGHVLVPDFAYKPTPMSDDYPDPVAPLWAVEVISPTDKAPDIRRKRQIYLQAGILLWEIYPDARSVDVYAPNQPVRAFGIDDTLDAGSVLPEFTLPVRDLFAE